MRRRHLLLLVLTLPCNRGLFDSSRAYADPPALVYVYPAGGQRGAEVNVRVGALSVQEKLPWGWLSPEISAPSHLEQAERIWFEGPVIPLPDSQQGEEYPQDFQGKISIAPSARSGIHRFQAWGAEGACRSLAFQVGEHPEVVEEEQDGDAVPVDVVLPVTINGRIFPRQDRDLWQFQAKTGRPVTIEVHANRIGSPLRPRLIVLDPNGKQVAEAIANLPSGDARLRIEPRSEGIYRIGIEDLDLRGLQHFVYRITVTEGTYLDSVYPLGGKRGSKTRFSGLGQNLPPEPFELDIPIQDAPVQFTSPSGDRSNPILIGIGEFEEFLEETRLEGPVPLPATINGRIRNPGEIDEWSITLNGGVSYQFNPSSIALGSPIVSQIELIAADGTSLKQTKSLDRDEPFEYTPTANGVFRLRISDQYSARAGDFHSYRISIEANPKPRFELSLNDDALTLVRGSTLSLPIQVLRQGMPSAIDLTVTGLPEGVTADPAKINENQAQGNLVLKATENARITTSRIRIQGTAQHNGATLENIASVRREGERHLEEILLATAVKVPFKYTGQYQIKYIPRGTTYLRKYSIDRGGFDGPLTVRLANRQTRHLQGVQGPTLTIPPGVQEFEYPVFLPPWMEIGRTSRTMIEISGELVDQDGIKHRASFSTNAQESQMIAIVDPELLGVSLSQNSLLAVPGAHELMVQIVRHPKVSGLPLKLELVSPDHFEGLRAEPVELSADADRATFTLQLDATAQGPWNTPVLIRATGNNEQFGRIVAETKLELVAPGKK